MKKIDKAVEIIRGWIDEDIKKFIPNYDLCPYAFGLEECVRCGKTAPPCCEEGWNEEESE